MAKIKGDYVGWILTIAFGVIALIFGNQNKILRDNKLKIHNSAQVINQYITNNNYQLPDTVKVQLENILTVSGDTARISQEK